MIQMPINLFTSVELPPELPQLTHTDPLLLLGSCFAGTIGARLTSARFRCDVNPYGVLYNPLSISTALREILAGKCYDADDLFFFRDLWHSPMHHSDFSAPTPEATLLRINSRLQTAHEQLPTCHCLLLTLGSAWVYRQKNPDRIVGNCHRLPEASFSRSMLSVDDIVLDYRSLLSGLLGRCPELKIIFTVSPIRHLRDGMHANQLSKSTLLLAINALETEFSGRVFYFPAYELLMDELRDYRFYGDDLVHPSETAVNYIWQRFGETCFPEETRQIIDECGDIARMLAHKPFNPESDSHKRFLEQIVLKEERLIEKYPYLGFK